MYFYNKNKNTISENQPLVEIGQSTSFILHEISKPIKRIEKNPNKEDIEQIISFYNLANVLSIKVNNLKLDDVHIINVVNSIILKYSDALSTFNIQIVQNATDRNIILKSNCKLLEILIDNLIKNAIENNIQNNSSDDIYINISENELCIQNTLFNSDIEIEDMLRPGFSTKNGNMGMGLMIISNICNNLNHKLEININKKEKKLSFKIIF